MKAVEAGWYDRILPGSRAMAPLEESSALPVYEAAALFVDKGLPVIDLGCGTGRFAELLRRSGIERYVGLDFAEAVVGEARRYCPDLLFHEADLRDSLPVRKGRSCYVLLEVLEHLDDDRGLLAQIRPGHQVVLSVPNFWSESHVRVFESPEEVEARYGDLLTFVRRSVVTFPQMPEHRIFVFEAERA